MYNALDIARYVIAHENECGRSVSNLRLQKLLYFIQVAFVSEYGPEHPCFSEPIEAWSFGPVVPCVYHAYKMFGSAGIPSSPHARNIRLQNADKNMIDNMLNDSARYSTSQLVEISHHQTPWIEAHRNPFDNQITNESIAAYFQ